MLLLIIVRYGWIVRHLIECSMRVNISFVLSEMYWILMKIFGTNQIIHTFIENLYSFLNKLWLTRYKLASYGIVHNIITYLYNFREDRKIYNKMYGLCCYTSHLFIYIIYYIHDRTTNLFNQHRLRAAMITFGPRTRWVVEWSILCTDKCLKEVGRGGGGGGGTINII